MGKLIKRLKKFQPGGRTYPSDLPWWGREVYDSYELPKIQYVNTQKPYVQYEGNKNEPGRVINVTGILPEVTITPSSYNSLSSKEYYNPYNIFDVYNYYADLFDNGTIQRDVLHIDPVTGLPYLQHMLLQEGRGSKAKYDYGQLNAIAEDAAKEGMPLIYMLGWPYKETTWNNDVWDTSINKLWGISDDDDHAIKETTQNIRDIDRIVNSDGTELWEPADQLINYELANPFAKVLGPYRWRSPYSHNSDIEPQLKEKLNWAKNMANFLGYKNSNIGRAARYFGTGEYNHNQRDYYQLVENLGRDMLSQPAVQEWIKTQPYYNSDTIEEDFLKYKKEHNLYNK